MEIKKRFFNYVHWLWPKTEELVSLDLHGWHKGKYFEIEIKKTGGEPTDAQWRTIYYLREIGVISFYADSLTMFLEKFKKSV